MTIKTSINTLLNPLTFNLQITFNFPKTTKKIIIIKTRRRSRKMATEISCENRKHDEHVFRSRYPSVPVPDDLTLPEFVLQDAELYGEKVAIVEADTRKSYTYNDVVSKTRRFAGALRSIGIRKGHVIVVVLPNVAEYPIIALGIMAAGAIFSGSNPAGHVSEIKKQVDSAGARLVVTDHHHYEKVKGLGLAVITVDEEPVEGAINWDKLLDAADKAGVPRYQHGGATSASGGPEKPDQSDLCALPFSSGTTGLSKGVMLSHRNLVANLCSSLFAVTPDLIGKVTVLGLMPFFHIYGITGICCATLRNRGTVVAMRRYEVRAFMAALIDHEVTFAPVVPPIISDMVYKPAVGEFDLSRLKLQAIMSAAAPLAPELLRAFEAKFPGVHVQEAYGMTEHSCITLTHGVAIENNYRSKKNSVGFILPNLEVKFIDPDSGRSLPKNTPGEICVRSQCVMQGYYNNKEETERAIDKEGWLHTGDIAYIDDDGDIFIVDRIKEMIKFKGFQVAPAELEAILLTHPSIEDAAVFPLPDEEAGEIPAACVVLASDAKESEEEILNYVTANVAHYKKVRVLRFVDSIPKSPSGKIMRRLLKDTMMKDSTFKFAKK